MIDLIPVHIDNDTIYSSLPVFILLWLEYEIECSLALDLNSDIQIDGLFAGSYRQLCLQLNCTASIAYVLREKESTRALEALENRKSRENCLYDLYSWFQANDLINSNNTGVLMCF
jgi:hypothetical protein